MTVYEKLPPTMGVHGQKEFCAENKKEQNRKNRNFWEKFWLCPRKWLMLFSLKFQRNNQQNALAMDSTEGKAEEKGCIFTVLWR